jgi:tetratricopeptide (TPR) repeat protein
MKNLTILCSLLFLFGCASTPDGAVQKKSSKKAKKSGELQDVRTVDSTYSENIKTVSSLRKVKSKVPCANHTGVDKANWRDLLEAGFSCIQEKKWTELNSIAAKLSHNHLKAPWGPYYRSIVAEHRGDLARSLWMADLALKKSPDNALILYQKARVLWLSQKESQSYTLMKDVIKKDPTNYDAFLFLGNIHYRDREFKEALTYYNKVLEFNSGDVEYRAALGETLFFTGKYKESVKHYKAASSKMKLNGSLYYKIGLAYKNLKDWELSKSYLEKAISQKRKGRSLASLGDMKIRKDLNEVIAKINSGKEKNVVKESK